MSKQQTAVEWLEDRLDNLLELYASEWDKVSNVINKAKAMEKEQIVKAHGVKQYKSSGTSNYVYNKSGEEYYKELYEL